MHARQRALLQRQLIAVHELLHANRCDMPAHVHQTLHTVRYGAQIAAAFKRTYVVKVLLHGSFTVVKGEATHHPK